VSRPPARPRSLLVVGLGADRTFSLRTLLRLPYRLVLLDDPAAPHLPVADVHLPLDWGASAEEVAAAVDGAIGRHHPAGVLTFIDEWLPAVAAVARRHGLPAHGDVAAAAGRDKVRMRRMFDAAGVAQAPWRACGTLAEAASAADAIGLPVAVKPSNGSNSSGVTRVGEPDALGFAFKLAWMTRRQAEGSVLVEGWLDGAPVDVYTISSGGRTKAVCAFQCRNDLRSGRPWCLGYHGPAAGPAAAGAARLACRAVGALGIADGVSLVELMVVGGRPMVLEVNARPSGAAELIELAGGPNLFAVAATLAAGDPLPAGLAAALAACPDDQPLLPIPWRGGAAVRNLDRVAGRIEPATVRALAEEEGVASVVVHTWEGDGRVADNHEIDHGYVVTTAGDSARAAATAEALAARLGGGPVDAG
jgi:biotin carboxylase